VISFVQKAKASEQSEVFFYRTIIQYTQNLSKKEQNIVSKGDGDYTYSK